jgi:eukaryotic-like serine/threonine-protein kinase
MGDAASAPFYQRAVELDPNFALAYARLGTVYTNMGEDDLGEQYTRKAFELQDRVSEYEKLYITSHYYEFVTLDLDKALETYNLWSETYPRDFTPVLNTAVIYDERGQFEKGLDKAQQAFRLDPDHVLAYENVAGYFAELGRYDEARAVLAQAAAHNLDDPTIHLIRYVIGFALKDDRAVSAEQEWAKGKPFEDRFVFLQAESSASQGKLREAQQLYAKSTDMARRGGHAQMAAGSLLELADVEALFGYPDRARRDAGAALQLDSRGNAAFVGAVVLAMTGDHAQAEELADQLHQQYPMGTIVNAVDLPLIRSYLESDPKRAIADLEAAQSFDRASLQVVYHRAEAYLQSGTARNASAEFQKVVSSEGKVITFPVHSLGRLGLARARAMMGDKTAARTAYQDFLARWKDADPDLPILRQARAEYEQLK